jgi:hypothetical protein
MPVARQGGSSCARFTHSNRVKRRAGLLRLPASTLKRHFKVLEYKYRVKTAALDIIKRYSILSLTLYLEWYNAYSIVDSDGPH